ncbi:sensor histidine kinase [Sphingomonas sp. S1-29]|uniref:sensor histidine kinase n=1 Tax=Sphingomonas sp. S1-29 TaxID=2991074 RepID=UPI00223EBA7D|nr:sensor histidine kinase [Sphingomonas sp. S1-29]UZK69043.1 sensor histidine kinase [Sphingomonas sp. S1-29]
MQPNATPGVGGQRWYQRLVDVRGPWIWLVYLPLFGVPWLGNPPNTLDLVASAAGLALFLALYIYAARVSGRRIIASAILMMALAIAMIPFGGNWAVLAVYACSTAAELRPARHAVRLVAGLMLVSIIAVIGAGLPWYVAVMVPLFEAMVVYGKMAGLALGEKHGALLRAQEEVRLLAREAERERIARDLHDLLGRTLTLIALKSDLAARLADTDPAAAKREIDEVGQAARGGLAEVRATVADMHHTGLAREIEASRAALRTAGVACTVIGEELATSAANSAVLAMALRESITNVIRHAAATSCTIALQDDGTAVALIVSDDGRGGQFREGSGLRGMRARLSAAGGRLRVEARGSGTRVTAAVPAAVA